MTDEGPLMLTPRQVQQMLQLSPSTVYRMLNSGLIPSVRIGRSRRVLSESILGLIDSSRL